MSWHGSKQSGRHGGGGRNIGHGAGHRDNHSYDEERHGSAAQWGRVGEPASGGRALGHNDRGGTNDPAQSSGIVSKFAIFAAIAALVLWSLLAWGTYGLVDVLGGWLSANGGTLLQGGKDAAGAVGIGKEIIDRVDIQGANGVVQQLIAAALVVARPTIVFVWFLGALAIVAAPLVVRRLGRLVRSRH
ncbi:hypothetical protein ACFWXH_12990 [Mesorhizobium sp. NPDC059054]|uniref:hypothetical protein n=1 Tax=Mesorhizobium sp. NPDC059054 TaxID=3346711 RepID=UPI0036B0DA00